jgi:hypothetical protein
MELVRPIMRHHHEKWDGSGYPDGLKGEAIPLGARIISVVDVFDALHTDRPYRRPRARRLSHADPQRPTPATGTRASSTPSSRSSATTSTSDGVRSYIPTFPTRQDNPLATKCRNVRPDPYRRSAATESPAVLPKTAPDMRPVPPG